MGNNSFKINEIVLVKGFGKCNNKYYHNIIGRVICRDPYFKDYNIKFQDGTEDWFNLEYLNKYKEDENS